MDVALELRNISVRVNNISLVEEVSARVHAGEILAVVGANGAGKTTLFNAIVQDVELSQGQVLLGGQDISAIELRERATSIAILPQFSLLNFPYTVSDVVMLGRVPHSSGVDVDAEVVAQCMEAVDISHLKQRVYTQLSGGEKQRTQLARVMAQVWRVADANTRVILLDEPTSSLDLAHQHQLMQAIKNLSQSGVGVVMIVHDINTAAIYADSVLGLSCGRVICSGKTDDVLNEDTLLKLFNTELTIVRHPKTGRKVVI